MNKLIILLFVPLVSWNSELAKTENIKKGLNEIQTDDYEQSKWTRNEKNNFMVECIKNYVKSAGNEDYRGARCYCICGLNYSMEKFETAIEADNKMTTQDIQNIGIKCLAKMALIKDKSTCL